MANFLLEKYGLDLDKIVENDDIEEYQDEKEVVAKIKKAETHDTTMDSVLPKVLHFTENGQLVFQDDKMKTYPIELTSQNKRVFCYLV